MTAFGGALDDPTKVMGSRIGAFIVDTVLATVFTLVVFGMVTSGDYTTFDASDPGLPGCSELTRSFGDPNDPTATTCLQFGDTVYLLSQSELNSAQTLSNALFFGFTFANAVLLQSIGGASLGKRLFGLRVAVPSGQPAGIGRNLVRWLMMIVDTLCCFLPGLISANSSKGHRRLGDMVAGTFVVHRSAIGRMLRIPGVAIVQKHEFGTFGPAPVRPELTPAEGGGIDAPAWDPARNTYVRYDPAQGVWFQWDDIANAWVPVQG